MKKGGDNMKGLILAARYVLKPAELRICIEDKEKFDALLAFLKNPAKFTTQARQVLERMPVCYPYLKIISQAHGIHDPFDLSVVQAYFIGNSLLEGIEPKSIRQMLMAEFNKLQFLDKEELEKRINSLSENFIPHHTFHVYCFGSVTGKVKPIPEMLDLCRISWGHIAIILDKKVWIDYYPIIQDSKGKFILAEEPQRIKIDISRLPTPEVDAGDWVSLHWKQICQKLTPSQLEDLRKYTVLALDIANAKGEV
ncbi:hypothetical protein J7L09_02715 [bacterium]|nr:hypothetical protein [bacterium]